jgi:putative Mn2+ efflux pump MntP
MYEIFMDILTPFLIGVGLSMDCLAVSLVIGATSQERLLGTAVVIATSFGLFQAGMTFAGWVAGFSLIGLISSYGHWIAFLLLIVIGIKMIREGIGGDSCIRLERLQIVPVILLSVATSIDALAAGVSFGVLQAPILFAALMIGIVCFVLSFSGVVLGKNLRGILGIKMDLVGGGILILIGIRILFDHRVM